ERMVGLMAAERRVVFFLLHPLIPIARKEEFLKLVCESDVMRRLIRILVETKNLNLAGEISSQFGAMARREMGVVKATVKTATGLDQESLARLRQALDQLTGKKVDLEAQADPGVLAGVWVRIGDKVIDNTLRTELKAVRERLVSS
ncbi:MAG TPA: ATP synthase F1 subunit delta, partial [bacterium]|nr:ATP synthase F1 subunit delta [bacterium]